MLCETYWGGADLLCFLLGVVSGGGGGIFRIFRVIGVSLSFFFLHWQQEYCSYLLFILSYHRLLLVKNSPRTGFNDPNDQNDDADNGVDDDDDDA